jgi:hypothetical protein
MLAPMTKAGKKTYYGHRDVKKKGFIEMSEFPRTGANWAERLVLPYAKRLLLLRARRTKQSAQSVGTARAARRVRAWNAAGGSCPDSGGGRLAKHGTSGASAYRPTIGAIAQFERELVCEGIRPRLRRLRESVEQ